MVRTSSKRNKVLASLYFTIEVTILVFHEVVAFSVHIFSDQHSNIAGFKDVRR